MKTQTIHQEILLNASASFFNREFCLKDSNSSDTAGNPSIENLEKACWAGMLFELLPELAENPCSDCKTYLWRTLNGEHFLMINRGSYPALINKGSSIDPHSSLPTYCRN
ncbi:MAG: hypothetical protein ABUT20_15705 [Bacteroidota bacterium]